MTAGMSRYWYWDVSAGLNARSVVLICDRRAVYTRRR